MTHGTSAENSVWWCSDSPVSGSRNDEESNAGGAVTMRPVPINENHHTREELEHLAKNCKDKLWERRILGVALAMSGLQRTEVARSQGVGAQTLRDWICLYNEGGVEGLRPQPRGGSKCRLSAEKLETLQEHIEAGPGEEAASPSRFRLCDIAAMIKDRCGVHYTLEGTRQVLRRIGFRWISPCPIHPKADVAAQKAFCDTFQARVAEVTAGKADKTPIEIWFQDETRMGQKGMLRRIWARKCTRPRVKRDHRYKYCVLFSAACPEHHLSAAHLCERSNTEEMNRHLGDISAAVQEGHHAVVVMDRASWHRSNGLEVPANLSLLHLPPYAPELNAIERVNGQLKDNYGGRFVRVRGHAKVFCHLMFGIVVMTAERLMRLAAINVPHLT